MGNTRQLVRDDYVFSNSCYENVVAPKRKGVLKTIKGPVAEWGELNRNGRKYSERLWDKVLESDYVAEQMDNKTLYGEANHPTDRFEIDFSRVSHNISEMHKVPDKQQVCATIDILDTPLGNILNVLYEYGSVIGFSSRAGGVLKQKKGYIEVDEETYHFITFDAVPYPSVKNARPLNEGVEGMDKVEISEEAHSKICEIIESSSKKDKEILKDFIYSLQNYSLDRELSILEGLNSKDDDKSNESLKNTTLCLLKESYKHISSLKEELNLLKDSSIQKDSDTNKLLEETLQENVSVKKDLNELVEQVKELKLKNEVLIKVEEGSTKLKEILKINEDNIISLGYTISEQEDKISDLELKVEEMGMYKEELDNKKVLYEKTSESMSKIETENSALVTENLRLKGDIEKYSEVQDYDDLVKEFANSLKELASIKESHAKEMGDLRKSSESQSMELLTTKKLVRELRQEKESANKQLVAESGSLKTAKLQMNAVYEEYNSKIKSLNEQVENLSQVNADYKVQIFDRQKDLVKSVSGQYGLESSLVLEKLDDHYSLNDIYIACESLIIKDNLEVVSVEDVPFTSVDKKPRILNTVYSNTGSRRGIMNKI
jgi:myosin heavy subunit